MAAEEVRRSRELREAAECRGAGIPLGNSESRTPNWPFRVREGSSDLPSYGSWWNRQPSRFADLDDGDCELSRSYPGGARFFDDLLKSSDGCDPYWLSAEDDGEDTEDVYDSEDSEGRHGHRHQNDDRHRRRRNHQGRRDLHGSHRRSQSVDSLWEAIGRDFERRHRPDSWLYIGGRRGDRIRQQEMNGFHNDWPRSHQGWTEMREGGRRGIPTMGASHIGRQGGDRSMRRRSNGGHGRGHDTDSDGGESEVSFGESDMF